MVKGSRFALYVSAWVAFFALTALTPIFADDFGNLAGFYRHAPLSSGQAPTWRTFFGVPDLLGNLLALTWAHWNGETGRFAAAFLLRLTAGMPHWAFAMLNATAWVALWGAVCRLCGVTRRWEPLVLALGFVVALSMDACLWMAGACNYLWPMAWTLALACAFPARRLGESVFARRNLWMAALLPLGFVAAGGHELLAVPVCLGLAVYWVREMALGRFAVTGRLLLTVGFGLGALAVVFAPGSLERAGGGAFFMPDAQFLFSVARKGMAYLRCCVANPLLPVVTALSAVAAIRRVRFPLPARAWWVLLFGWLAVFATCALADGSGRTGWPVSVLTLMMALVLAPAFAPQGWARARVPLTALAAALAVTVVGVTAAGSVIKARETEALLRAWAANPHHAACYREPRALPVPGWFDRSWERLVEWGVGVPWTNPAVARFYGKPFCLMAEPIVWDEVYRRDTFCVPANRLPCGWYAQEDADVLVLPLPRDSAFAPGERLSGKPTYRDLPPPLTAVARIRKRILREGWASFSLASPEEEMRRGAPLSGYVLGTAHGAYAVLRHNRNIPRASIVAISLARVD